MNYSATQIPVGTTITVRAWDGTEGYGRVTGHGENKGRACVEFIDSDGGNRWAYLTQVTGIFS